MSVSRSNMEEIVNISSEPMVFELDGAIYELKPKDRVKVHKNYAMPRVLQKGRDPVASTVELLTNKKVLWIKDRRACAALGLAYDKNAFEAALAS